MGAKEVKEAIERRDSAPTSEEKLIKEVVREIWYEPTLQTVESRARLIIKLVRDHDQRLKDIDSQGEAQP